MVEQLVAETVSLLALVKEDAMLARTGRAEVVTHRPHRQHQIVEAQPVPGDQLAAVLVQHRRDHDLARRRIDALQRAEEEAIAPAMAMAAIADLIQIGVERTRCDLVEQRLPDMRAVPVDQDDVVGAAAEPRTQPPRKLKPARAPANDHDLGLARHRHCRPPVGGQQPASRAQLLYSASSRSP